MHLSEDVVQERRRLIDRGELEPPHLFLYSKPFRSNWRPTQSQNRRSSWACVYIPKTFKTAVTLASCTLN